MIEFHNRLVLKGTKRKEDNDIFYDYYTIMIFGLTQLHYSLILEFINNTYGVGIPYDIHMGEKKVGRYVPCSLILNHLSIYVYCLLRITSAQGTEASTPGAFYVPRTSYSPNNATKPSKNDP